jgi:serine/threonine-protein kinase HipA
MKENILSVRLHGIPVGTLKQTRDGKLRFEYLEDATRAVSLSMPLNQRRYGNIPCETYFGGLLPESVSARRAIARKFDVNPRNTFSLLRVIGCDCAGAISFQATDDPVEADSVHEVQAEPVPEAVLAEHIRELPQKPLFIGVDGLRLSLAGMQEKAAVCVVDGQVCLPVRRTPTTHILKPSIKDYPATVQNEYLCLRAAGRLGLSVPAVEIRCAENETYLLVKRYDRRFDNKKRILRLHQEDFAQATGSREKYQRYGGPGLKECFDLLLKSSLPVFDRNMLMEAVVFNCLIGNADAHAKNFAILHDKPGDVRLAPFYDILCTQAYSNLTPDMSMKIGSHYILDEVTTRDWEDFCKQAGLSFPVLRNMLRRQAETLPDIVRDECSLLKSGEFDSEVATQIVEQVERNCRRAQRLLAKP